MISIKWRELEREVERAKVHYTFVNVTAQAGTSNRLRAIRTSAHADCRPKRSPMARWR
jgi:hypothetical protein